MNINENSRNNFDNNNINVEEFKEYEEENWKCENFKEVDNYFEEMTNTANTDLIKNIEKEIERQKQENK